MSSRVSSTSSSPAVQAIVARDHSPSKQPQPEPPEVIRPLGDDSRAQDAVSEISSNEELQRNRIEERSAQSELAAPGAMKGSSSDSVANISHHSLAAEREGRSDDLIVELPPAGRDALPEPGAWGEPPTHMTRPSGFINALPGVGVFVGIGSSVVAGFTALSQGPTGLVVGLAAGGAAVGIPGAAVLVWKKFKE